MSTIHIVTSRSSSFGVRPGSLVAPVLAVVVAVGVGVGGCRADVGEESASRPVELEVDSPPEVVVSMESGLIGSVVDLGIGGDGRVYLLDGLAHGIHVLTPEGDFLRTLGREGQGPGEFTRPAALRVFSDSLVVKDVGNRRLQALARDGAPLGSRPLAGSYQGDVREDGSVVHPTLGMDSVLAVLMDPDGEEVARIGQVLAPPISVVNLAQMRAEIAQGEVPAIFLNTAEVRFADDGGVWLVIPAVARVERYDAQGRLLATATLDEPEFRAARERFVVANEDTEPNRVFPLRYIRALRPVGDHLWLLLDTGPDGPALIVVLAPDLQIEARLRFSRVRGAGHVSPTPQGDAVYFVLPDRAEMVRVELETPAPGTD